MTELVRSAQISPCGRYRYTLDRTWGDPFGPAVYWIMLNPSTADAEVDDPTIRRCISFSKRQEAERMRVVNLWPYRATKPSVLTEAAEAGIDLDGVGGRFYLESALAGWGDEDIVVAAWGASLPSLATERVEWVLAMADEYDTPLNCLGLTKAGHPRHPLYVKGDTPFQHYGQEASYG